VPTFSACAFPSLLAVSPGGGAHTAGGLLWLSAAPSHPQFLRAFFSSFVSFFLLALYIVLLPEVILSRKQLMQPEWVLALYHIRF